MKFYFMLLLLIACPIYASTTYLTTIYDIDHGQSANDETLVFLGNGKVAKLASKATIIIKNLEKYPTKDKILSITVDESRFITDIIETGYETQSNNLSEVEEGANNQYIPTTIENMSVAKKYFQEARYNPKDSQCFNRAMIWSYEWWRLHSLRSNKLFIFFTRTYIRRYNFEWWFHIAPLVHVMDNGKVVERMMDIKYSRGPLDIRQWTDLFMKNNSPCNIITKFSDYADNPYTGDCYIQRNNMYMYQPADLQMEEAWNYQKDKFIMNEVRAAYLEAYDEVI